MSLNPRDVVIVEVVVLESAAKRLRALLCVLVRHPLESLDVIHRRERLADFQPLDGREHRDCGRQHRVAIKQCRAGHAKQEHRVRAPADRVLCQRHQ